MFEFRVKPHLVTPVQTVVEVWRNGVFVATLYARAENVTLISKHQVDLALTEESHGLTEVHLVVTPR